MHETKVAESKCTVNAETSRPKLQLALESRLVREIWIGGVINQLRVVAALGAFLRIDGAVKPFDR